MIDNERMVKIRQTIDELNVLLRMSDGNLSDEGKQIIFDLEKWYADGAPPQQESSDV